MKKLSLLLLTILFCGLASVYAQDDLFWPPDYRQIGRNVQDPGSTLYFPRLMERYRAGDPTLSLHEGRHLYFGFVFQPEFTAADTSPYNQLLVNVLRRQTLTDQDYSDILRFSQALLQEDPFNLRALEAQLIALAHFQNMEEYSRVSWQRRTVILAITSTGNGMSADSPFFVTRAAHQFDILPFLGFSFGGNVYMVRNRGILALFSRNRNTVNALSLDANPFGLDKIYFDITPMMRRM